MDVKYNTKSLVSVEYPGTVLNVNNMIKTLGGEKQIFSAFQNSTKRLELKFRPDDPYCKGAHGDRFNSTNLVLKVVKLTKKLSSKSEPEVRYKFELLGVAGVTFKFKAMADFQMLPISFDKDMGGYKSLLPSLMPTTLHPASWLDEEVELFVPPMVFSRFDFPQSAYVDIQSKNSKIQEANRNLPPNIIGRSRKRRAGHAVFATFEGNEPCEKPQPRAVIQLKTSALDNETKIKLDALFEERPIWSRNALTIKLKCDRIRLKYSLPCVAYYFTNGPWRALWVRFGFNPRKHPASKSLQVLDLRINPATPINEKRLKTRPLYYTLPNKSTLNQQRVSTINTQDLIPTPKDEDMANEEDLNIRLLACEYFPGQLPTARQIFYQLCDIHLDSVQKLIHSNDGEETVCLDKDGWCNPGTLDKCRDLIMTDIQKTGRESKINQKTSVKESA